MIIDVKSLSKQYSGKTVVDELSFSSDRPEIIGLLGPNGAGKSTTMKMLTGYVRPSSGTATINGYDITSHPMEVKQSVGYLPESNPLYYNMYVREFLCFIASLYALSDVETKVEEAIVKVGLNSEAHKKIGNLSKGYKQRTGLAQVLLHDPSVLILDEATSGLDANQLHEIRELIKHLGKTKTILFSSHIMQEVEALCDRVIIIHQGRIIRDGSISVLKRIESQLRNLSLELLEPSKNIEAYKNLKAALAFDTDDFKNINISFKDSHDIRPEIFNTAVKNGDIVIKMELADQSIESVFQKLTKNT